MNNKIIKILRDVSNNKINLDEAKEMLLEFDDDGFLANEIDYIEENMEDSYLIGAGIKALIEDIESCEMITRKPSMNDLERVIGSIDSEKLLLKNMIII